MSRKVFAFKDEQIKHLCQFNDGRQIADQNALCQVLMSVIKTPQPLRIDPIDYQAYQPSGLSTIEPINH